jgi:hypothetical protein
MHRDLPGGLWENRRRLIAWVVSCGERFCIMALFGPLVAACLMGKIASMDHRSALGWGFATGALDVVLWLTTDWGGFIGDGVSCVAIFIAMTLIQK